MQITVDTSRDTPEMLRFAASVLYAIASGDLSPDDIGNDKQQAGGSDKPEAGTGQAPPPPEASAARTAPPPPGNVLPFPAPPPPAPNAAAAATPAGAGAPTAAGVAPNVPAAPGSASTQTTERDSAGLPWDARIHQKAKGRKKDGTWKLLKNIDPKVVEAVVRELSTAALPPNAAPAPIPPVSLQPASTVPLPPPPVGAAAPAVPAPPIPAPVPAAPAASTAGNGPVVAVPAFRLLVDKIAAATRDGKLTGERVSQIVQAAGAPNLQALFGMADLIPAVDSQIDAAILGL